MSMTPARQRERAYGQASSTALGLGLAAQFSLWGHARSDAKRNVPAITERGTVDWLEVPTWMFEMSNATKLARMTVLGLLIANRAELREYDALRHRHRTEISLRDNAQGLDRDETIERARRITRNITSIERQLPLLESYLTNSIREATSWGEYFFDAADQRIAYYWRVLRRRHPQGRALGANAPTFPRPEWLSTFSLADLLDLEEGGDLPGDARATPQNDRA